VTNTFLVAAKNRNHDEREAGRMTRPRLLDLCCGAGGAAMGYHRAGFDVVGIDKDDQPHYPFEFHRDDALEFLSRISGGFDAVHASWPCQGFTAYRRRGNGVGDGYPDLVTPGRKLLEASGLPWVMENVRGSPVRPTVHLCGSSFGLDVQRHRWFETNIPMMSPPCVHGIWKPRFPCATNRTNLRRTVEIGVYRIPLAVQRAAMGIEWMTLDELTEAIPPAYTEYIGSELADHLAARDAA
jgi:DNA (cytosine-5)-methyltransferase 1